RASGVTIILTTHYIEEAAEIADRVGVINGGALLLVEDKAALMAKLGRKQLILDLTEPISRLPDCFAGNGLTLEADGNRLTYEFDT
ncbi:multidrug ABC transporter ATP-binding protein, partial [Rhizobium ruizarguesonis]